MGHAREKLFNLYFFVITFVNLAVSAMMQMFNSTIALYVDGLNYGAAVSGTIISIGAVSASVYRFFGGKLCERAGRKQLIVGGIGCFAISSVLLGSFQAMPLIYIFRILQMLGYSMAGTAASVAVIDVLPQSRVGEGLGYYSLATFLPQAAGPTVALVLFQMKGGFFTVMVGAGLMGAIALGVTLSLLDYEKKWQKSLVSLKAGEKSRASDRENENGIWKYIEKKALPAAVTNFFIMFVGTLVTMYLTLYAAQSSIASPGMFFTLSAVAMIAARIMSGRLSDSFGVLAAVLPGTVMVTVSFLLLSVAAQVSWGYYAAGILYGFGTGMTEPALNAQAVKGVCKERVSIASSTFFLPIDIAFMAGSMLWGMLIDNMSFALVFGMAATISGATFIFALCVFSPKEKRIAAKSKY